MRRAWRRIRRGRTWRRIRRGRAWRRIRGALQSVTLASVAAALAWLVAHDALGHAQPFFAPIAAAIAISTSNVQRSRRIVQMVAGVLIGIAVGELLASALGTTTAALGLIVFLTMNVALLSAAGFVGEGMMFVNQAAASAILVVTLHRHSTGAERAVDALVGGGMALVLGVVLFPAEPLLLLANAERAVLESLAKTLQTLSEALRTGTRTSDDWVQKKGDDTYQLLAALARARGTAHANVRVAPRRWRKRAVVDAENRRTAQLDLLANAVLSLARSAAAALQAQAHVPDAFGEDTAALAAGLRRLAGAPRPWTAELLDDVEATATAARQRLAAYEADPALLVADDLRAVVGDLEQVLRRPAPRDTR